MGKVWIVASGAMVGAVCGFGAFAWIGAAAKTSPFDCMEGRMFLLLSAGLGALVGTLLALAAIDAAKEARRD